MKPKTFNVTLTLEQLNIVSKALCEFERNFGTQVIRMTAGDHELWMACMKKLKAIEEVTKLVVLQAVKHRTEAERSKLV